MTLTYRAIFWIPVLCFLVILPETSPATEYKAAEYKTTVLAKNLPQSWSLVILPDRRILIAAKNGNILLLETDGQTKKAGKISDSFSHGQGGLMDLTLSPDFAKDSLVYYSYTYRGAGESFGKHGTALGSFQWEGAGNRIRNQKMLLQAANLGYTGRHFGSRIVFDEHGFLYLALGDRGEPAEAQKLNTHKGKVLRLTRTGKVPPDNPFVNRKGARAEIYSYGHRNPQGMIFDPGADGSIWLHEHGPRGGDELNLVLPGANYGWPVISYGINYDGSRVGKGITAKPGMEQPLVYWVPSIAPSGMIRYKGDKFPQWKGDFFAGALAGRHLRRIVMKGGKPIGQEELLAGEGRIREVAQDKDGYMYVLTDASNSKLLRLEPVSRRN